MRSEIRTVIAVLATTAVLLGSATMALAADGQPVTPDPTPSTTTPSPSTSTPTPEVTEPTATPDPTDPTDPTDPAPTPKPTQDEPTQEVPTGAFTVNDAQVRWGINDESNNRAFAPGTFNFLSAGKIRNPGRGNQQMPQADWKRADGSVTIEKFLESAWTPATWAGLKTTSAGTAAGDQMVGTNGPFSNHEVVISGGKGTVDPAKGKATIQWSGSFTVIYYSGYSFFYVTDPKLTVDNGIGTLTATLGGYSSSMEDLDRWEAVPDAPNTVLANLGRVNLAVDLGFSAQPAYRGVTVNTGSGSPQVTGATNSGSFPQSFVDFQNRSGTGSYWYSSGGAADTHKVAKPVTVSYAAGSPVKVVAPKIKKAKKTKKVTNSAPAAPSNAPLASPRPPASQLDLPAAAPLPADVLRSGTAVAQFRPASTVTGLQAAADTSSTTGIWILGGVLLGGALLVTASPFAYSAARRAD